MARIASGNYDAVIVSHRSFEFLPVSDELFNKFMDEQVSELEAAILEAKAEQGDNRRLVKELEKAKKRFVTKLKQRADRERKDDTITFEELGVDQIFVDEADLYKNLFYTTKMNRIAGLPNSESNRAFDMFMKTRYLREITGGRGVVFATGTPISNTMAEMYTMLRYLAPDLLKERGVAHFDAWAANFAEAVTALELAPDGSGYRMHTRFAKFINLPELLSMFRTFSDVQTADMLNLPRPAIAGGRPQIVAAPASEPLKAYIKTLTERAERLRTARIDPSIDNMLKITGDGRKAALDMRLVDPFGEPEGETKLSLAVDRIREVWEKTSEARVDAAGVLRPLDARIRTGSTSTMNCERRLIGTGRAQKRDCLHPRRRHRRGKETPVRRRQRRPGAHPDRLDRKDGGGDQRAAAAQGAASSRRALAAARHRAARGPHPAPGQHQSPKSISTAT